MASPVSDKDSSMRWFIGCLIASTFSLAYIITPIYLIGCVLSFIFLSLPLAVAFCMLAIVSSLVPCIQAPGLTAMLLPMLDYFEYEEYFESSNQSLQKSLEEGGRRAIVAFQPHGVLSFCGMCAAINAPAYFRVLKTAVASSLMATPILKHVMGIFGFVDASKKSLQKHFKKPGVHGCVVLYVGGIAELFKCDQTEERLYLSNRKGFIKLALRENVDIIPAYLFGNTSALSVLKSGPLASLSRSTGVALTYFWGKFGLPIPRDDKCLYARAKPMGLPHIPDPTQQDIDKWHKKYCDEVTRLFETYKEKLPRYKHKKLFID